MDYYTKETAGKNGVFVILNLRTTRSRAMQVTCTKPAPVKHFYDIVAAALKLL
jgi:hypothetical protein